MAQTAVLKVNEYPLTWMRGKRILIDCIDDEYQTDVSDEDDLCELLALMRKFSISMGMDCIGHIRYMDAFTVI